MDEYFLDDEEVPAELLAEAERLAQTHSIHRVYFDKETGNIHAITNEENPNYENYFEMNTKDVEYLLNNERLENFKVSFEEDSNPIILLKTREDDSPASFLKKDVRVKRTDSEHELTIEQLPGKKRWVFSLTEEKRQALIDAGVGGTVDFFVIDPTNRNLLIRTISINFKDLYVNKKFNVPFVSYREEDESIEIFGKNFFRSIGHKVSNE